MGKFYGTICAITRLTSKFLFSKKKRRQNLSQICVQTFWQSWSELCTPHSYHKDIHFKQYFWQIWTLPTQTRQLSSVIKLSQELFLTNVKCASQSIDQTIIKCHPLNPRLAPHATTPASSDDHIQNTFIHLYISSHHQHGKYTFQCWGINCVTQLLEVEFLVSPATNLDSSVFYCR